MGRKLAEATKAWRIRCTRGETVRLRVLAGWRVLVMAVGFLAAVALWVGPFGEVPGLVSPGVA